MLQLAVCDDEAVCLRQTVDILRAYAALHDNICYLCGENCGVVASFFRLFELSDPDVDFYALSDQDDVWDEDKLSIACQKLEQMRKSKSQKKKKNDSQIRTFTTPLLYCCADRRQRTDSELSERID